MSLSLNIINRTLSINVDTSVGKFLHQFWQNDFDKDVIDQFSASDFEISVHNIDDPTSYFSHPAKELIESFLVEQENIDAYRLIENGQENCWLIGKESQGAYFRLEENIATIHYWGEGSLLPLIVNATIIETLRLSGLVPLHAAAASIDGEGYIFLGKSGTGKTTTLLRTIKSGWSPLAEDNLLVDPQNSLVYGWEKAIRLLPNSLKILDEPLRSHNWGKLYFSKYSVPYADLCAHYQTQRTVCFTLNHIVQLSRADNNQDQNCQWSELSSTQVSASLWNSIGLPFSGQAQQHTAENIGKIVKASRAWKLELGNINKPLVSPFNS